MKITLDAKTKADKWSPEGGEAALEFRVASPGVVIITLGGYTEYCVSLAELNMVMDAMNRKDNIVDVTFPATFTEPWVDPDPPKPEVEDRVDDIIEEAMDKALEPVLVVMPVIEEVKPEVDQVDVDGGMASYFTGPDNELEGDDDPELVDGVSVADDAGEPL